MKRRGSKSFLGQKQILIAGAVMLIAAAAMTFSYVASNPDESKQEIAQEQTKQQEQPVQTAKEKTVKEKEKDTEQPAKSVTAVVKPKEQKVKEEKVVKEEPESEKETKTEKAVDEAVATAAAVEPHFDAESGLNWPLQGDVILNYSMDQTVYFATLDQYKYNPAVVIAGEVNERVSNAAAGKISDISTNEVTGCTVRVDLGDGYTAIYGQLKDVPYQVGDYVESGSTIGFISEPTKYYSLEGSNLYFELQKDDAPVDPVSYFQ